MYGFKPKSARGKTVQNFADGGIVHSIKGALGLRPKTREELLAADAKAQARNQEAAVRVASRSAPAPAPAPLSAISDYSGMNAMQRREKEQGLKNGGMVKPHGFKAGGLILGPGTGTSDSIQTEKRPGTFIMPADSTQAIGPEVLEELGEPMEAAEEADGMEFESAENEGPEEEGEGEEVPVRLSNGEFELPPDQVQALGEAVLTVLRDATHERTEEGRQASPKAAGFAPSQFFADGGTVQAAYDDWQSKKQPWYMPTPRGNMEERTAEANYSQALQNQFSPKTTAPAPTTTQNATDVRLAAGTVASPGAMAAVRGSATPPKPAAAPVSMTGAPQQRAVQAQPFDFDTFEPAPGEGAFRNEQTGEVTRLQTVPSGTQIWKPQQQAPAAPAGFVPTSQRQVVRAPVLNPNGGVFSSMVDFTNQAGQAVQAIAANKGMRNDRKDALDQQRVGLDAASTFAKIEQGDRALGIDGRRADTAQDIAALQADELGLKREAAGFQTREAAQQEQLRNVLLDQKSTPEQRAVAQRNLAALSGKTAADRMQTVALPDTTNEMGQVVRGGQALVRVLEDGSVQQVPIGAQQGAALPPGMKRQIGTSNGRPVYEDMNGKKVIAKG